MDKRTLTTVVIVAVVVLIASDKLRSLPVVNKLPTV